MSIVIVLLIVIVLGAASWYFLYNPKVEKYDDDNEALISGNSSSNKEEEEALEKTLEEKLKDLDITFYLDVDCEYCEKSKMNLGRYIAFIELEENELPTEANGLVPFFKSKTTGKFHIGGVESAEHLMQTVS